MEFDRGSAFVHRNLESFVEKRGFARTPESPPDSDETICKPTHLSWRSFGEEFGDSAVGAADLTLISLGPRNTHGRAGIARVENAPRVVWIAR